MQFKFILFFLFFSTHVLYSQQTVGLFDNDSSALNGYTLIAPLQSTEVFLVDNCGFVVNQWKNSAYKPAASVYLLDDGSIMRTCNTMDTDFSVGGSGGRLEQYDWDDNLIWSYNLSDATQRAHHDIEVLPNGNILVLLFELRTNEESLAAGRDPALLASTIWSEKVIELEPVGTDGANIVWEWYLWDHMVQDFELGLDNHGSIKDHPELVDLNYPGHGTDTGDWIHANALAYNPTLDQVMICCRNYDEFWVIDHSTTTEEAASHSGGNAGKGGDIIYRWGNPETYKAGTVEDKKLFGPHDAHWIPDGLRDGGKIMVFNNGFELADQISRVQIINPPLEQGGTYTTPTNFEAFLPADVEWSYQSENYVDFISGAQRLENGNTLINEGPIGLLVELDSTDVPVWRYVNPVTANGSATQGEMVGGMNLLFRGYKFPTDYSAFDGKDLTPGDPIELNPTPSDCQLYFPSSTIDLSWGELDMKILGNPIEEELLIENNSNSEIEFVVVDLSGKRVLEDKTQLNTLAYNARDWASGVYFVFAIDETNQKLFRQQVIKM